MPCWNRDGVNPSTSGYEECVYWLPHEIIRMMSWVKLVMKMIPFASQLLRLHKSRHIFYQFAVLIVLCNCCVLPRISVHVTQYHFEFIHPCLSFQCLTCVHSVCVVFQCGSLIRALLILIQWLIPVLIIFPSFFIGWHPTNKKKISSICLLKFTLHKLFFFL